LATNGRLPIDILSRRLVAVAFVSLLGTAAISVAFIGLTRSVSEGLLEAQAASGAPEAPLSDLADVLVWGQAAAIATLFLLTATLFGFAWYLRTRVAPLETLQRSAAASAAEPEERALHGLKPLIERLVKDGTRLEADFARLSSTTNQARSTIEDASLRAAKASHTAIEAAGIVREGTQRMTLQAADSMSALAAAMANRAYVLRHVEGSGRGELAGGIASDTEVGSVLTSLAGDLEALERFARDRKTIPGESAAVLTVALVDAIDRLNGLADRISEAADLGPKSEAA
jgi:hypothetical protein